MRIRLTAFPKPGELDEFDFRRFRVGEIYDLPPHLASVLLISRYAELAPPLRRQTAVRQGLFDALQARPGLLKSGPAKAGHSVRNPGHCGRLFEQFVSLMRSVLTLGAMALAVLSLAAAPPDPKPFALAFRGQTFPFRDVSTSVLPNAIALFLKPSAARWARTPSPRPPACSFG